MRQKNYTKLMLAGLTAALVLNGATAVFAEDTAEVNTAGETIQDDTAGQQTTDRLRKEFRKMTGTGENEDMPEIDMSGLDLPEDFVPFDENHVPDGLHAPKNGEIRPIEFDEEGNMIFGQRPDGEMPPMNGERPMNGEMPELPEGEMPEFPDGEMPPMNGERPELPNGEMPELPDGELPELPDGEMPELPDGELPEFPESGAGPMMSGQGPQDMQSGQNFPMISGQGPQQFGMNA